MNKKSKLILASAVFIAALMLLVPLSQANMSGGGVQENHTSDSIVLSSDSSEITTSTYYVSNSGDDSTTNGTDSAAPYKTIRAAVSAAKSGDTIKLLSDINSSESKIEIKEKSIILDLNGKTLNTSGKNRIEVAESGSLTITDSSDTIGKIEHAADSSGNSAIKVCGTDGKTASLTLNKCILISEYKENDKVTGGYGIFASNYSEVICGSESDAEDSNVSITSGASAISGNGLMTSCDVTIYSGKYVSETSAAIYFPSSDKLTVAGGEFTGKTGFDIRAGTVEIKDAKVTANGSASNEKTENDGPTAWGMGVAVFDNSIYGNNISISIADVAFECTTYDIYIGQHKVTGTKDAPTTFDIKSNSTNSPNDSISLTVKDSFTYNISNSDKSKSIGGFAANITNDGFEFADKTVIGSACTLTVEGKAIIGENVTVTNNGTLTSNGMITGLGKLTGSADVLIDLVKGTVSGITFELSDTNDCKAIVVSSSATGNVTIENCTIDGWNKTTPDCGIYVNSVNSNVLISKVTFKDFSSNMLPDDLSTLPIPINVDVMNQKGKVKISECTFDNCNRSNNVVFDAHVDATIGKDQNIDFDCDTRVCIWSSDDHNKTFSIAEGITFTNKSILTIDDSTSLTVDGKLIYDGVYNKTEDSIKTLDSGLIIKIKGTGSLEVKNINFKTKGLYVEGANNVTIQNCIFKTINESLDTNEENVNAIYIENCNHVSIGSRSIGYGNVIDGVSKTNIEGPNYGRGIYINNCSATIDISHNTISNIAFNAIQITNVEKTSTVPMIYDNKISEWDSDNDSVSTGYSDMFAGGRAIRIDIGSAYRLTISDNIFSKTYLPTNGSVKFSADIGNGIDKVGYDDGNVIKANFLTDSARLKIGNNTLNKSSLEYADSTNYIILPKLPHISITANPSDLGKAGDRDITVEDLVTNYNLNPDDIGQSFKPTGTLKYVTGYTGFSDNVTMQSGYYLPLRINFNEKSSDLTNLSVKVYGIPGLDLDQSDLEPQPDSNGNAYMDIVVFVGSSASSQLDIYVELNSNDHSNGMIYEMSLFELELEQSMLPAPLNDTRTTDDKLDLSDYSYSIYQRINGIIEITAYNIPYHQNAENDMGYWVGVAIPVPVGLDDITKSKYYFGYEYNISNSDYKSFTAEDVYEKDGKRYVCFYMDASYSAPDLQIMWDESSENMIPYRLVSVVTYKTPDVIPAPLVDHSNSSEKEIILNEYETFVGFDWGPQFIYITAKDVPKHVNGVGTSGYWVGIGFKVPTGTDFNNAKVLTGWGLDLIDGDLNNIDWSKAVSFDSYFIKDESMYCSMYYDVESSSKNYNSAVILIDWAGDGLGVMDSLYIIDFSNVTKKSSSTGGSGGGGVPITPPDVPDVPDQPAIIPDSNGNVDVVIDDKKADELVHEAVSSGSDSITILDTKNVSGNVSSVTVSKSDLETISKKIENNKNINSVSIETSKGDIIIEKEVLSSILENTKADSVSFEVEDAKNKLTEEQKKAVGDRPVYDINIKAGNENITSFDGKTITISLPYTLKAGEDPENIIVYYVKEDGSLEKVNCEYKNGKVTFETNHLSKYVIGYEEQDKPVTPDNPDDNKKDDNNTIYYAVAAVIVILIIIALAYYFMKKKQ